MITHSHVSIAQDDIQAVNKVMVSGQLAQGPVSHDFEKSVARFIGVHGGVSVQTGTAALHLALQALNIQPGDEVMLPSYVCVAPLNAIYHAGAKPVLVDIEPFSFNIDPDDAIRKCTSNTKAIIVPHLFGHAADLQKLRAIGIPIIEDLAQSIGAEYQGMPLGSFGEMAVCSFYATKVITTGEGGMVLSNKTALLDLVSDLKEYDNKDIYQPRYNYKMTDMQAALGISQLGRLTSQVIERQKIAAYYSSQLYDLPIDLPTQLPACKHIYYRYVVRCPSKVDEFIVQMEINGISCRRPIFRPLHWILEEPGYHATEEAYQQAVSIPLYPGLKEIEQKMIVQKIRTVCEALYQ